MKSTSSTKMPDISEKMDASGDAPPLTQADFDRARLRVAGKDASRAEWQAAVRACIGKQHQYHAGCSVEHFKALAGERGYQTIINDTLRRIIETGMLEADLRRIIREELATPSIH